MNQTPLILSALLLSLLFVPLAHALPETELTPKERDIVQQKISQFYSAQDSQAMISTMNSGIPKFDAQTGEQSTVSHPVARAKAKPAFRKWECKHFISRHFPGMACDDEGNVRATLEANDKVENLTKTWMDTTKLSRTLNGIPIEGKTEVVPWSDDYWKFQWGSTSYRYSSGASFNTYDQAVNAYHQPSEFAALSSNLPQLTLTAQNWSPAEKYDLTVGDENFSMTQQQKKYGESLKDETGDVPEWMGNCHGWAPAAFMAPKALKSVTVLGARGIPVKWYPHDTRAMATLAWANSDYESGFIGGRCNSKKAEMYPNGRIKQQACFDNNPATFHLSLGNLIGINHSAFVMDASFDYEVWNQPLYSYQFTYFNPLKTDQVSPDWKTVAVNYDASFKAIDRFQKPLTRGIRAQAGYNDSQVKKIVGVIATVTYLTEITPRPGDVPVSDRMTRVNYIYDLEIGDNDAVLGGEWHNNNHPDFLWLPVKNSLPFHNTVTLDVKYNGDLKTAVPNLNSIAAGASLSDGYPMWQVISHLLNNSK